MPLRNLVTRWALRGTALLRQQFLGEMIAAHAEYTDRLNRLVISIQRKHGMQGHSACQSSQENLRRCVPSAFRWVFVSKETALYSRCSAAGRPHQVWLHRRSRGSPADEDTLVFTDNNDCCSVDVALTRDENFVIITSNSRTTSEVHLLPVDDLKATPTLIRPREHFVEYYVEHAHGQFYIFTNLGLDKEYKVMVAEDSKPSLWKEFYLPKDGLVLHDMELFEHYIVLCGSRNLVPVVMVIDAQDPQMQPIILHTEEACQLERDFSGEDFESSNLVFWLSSPITLPRPFVFDGETITEYKMGGDQSRSVKSCDDYVVERVVAMSANGAEVPMTLCYRGDLVRKDRTNPTLVQVYGCYGESLHLGYQPEQACLLDRGWVLAFCHARGGGELGRGWYYNGQLANKRNTFEDLRACVELLHNEGYSQPSITAIHGKSAGGLAAAMFCNLWPSLARAAILQVPFVDVVASLQDSALYLTAKDHEEFGNPNMSEVSCKQVQSICPYSNLKPQDYPSVLVTAAKHDTVVQFKGVQRYVRKLQKCIKQHKWKQDRECLKKNACLQDRHRSLPRGSVLFLVDKKHGHHGSEEPGDRFREIALQYSFLYSALDL